MSVYSYSISSDFPNSKVSTDRLEAEIRASDISIALAYITTEGPNCTIYFRASLDDTDKGLLDGVVATHQGNSLDENILTKVELYNGLDKVPSASTGVPGLAPAKGLGGFVPDPTNNPYEPMADEVVSLYVDGEGSLVVRSNILTDEGSFRDDFTTSLFEPLTGTVTFEQGSKVITGVGTLFTEELSRDYYIRPLGTNDPSLWTKIVRAPNDTKAFLERPFEGLSGSLTAEKTKWVVLPVGAEPGSVSMLDSKIRISSGDHPEGGVHIFREGDYGPFIGAWKISVSQRVPNQEAWFGFRDDILNPQMYCDVIMSGTDDQTLLFRSACGGDEQVSPIILPSLLNTEQFLRFKIEVASEYCAILVNGARPIKHDVHVPSMYEDLYIGMGVTNKGVTSNTDVTVDTHLFDNHNQVRIVGSTLSPIPVITREDQHSIGSLLRTSSTESDQLLLSYTVPEGKVCYIIGYRLTASGPVSGLFKIGRNDLTEEPASPGVVDGQVFRVLGIQSNGLAYEEFGANPRLIGVGGDTLMVTITPDEELSNDWRVYLDFVLR